MTYSTRAYAAFDTTSELRPHTILRRDVGPKDVRIDVEFEGICHSDIHTVKGDWGPQPFPVVPGHEVIGRVAEVGSAVTKFAVGDRVGVGVFVDSCGECVACKDGREQHCANGPVWTYGAPDPDFEGQTTHGGYSQSIVVTEHAVLRVPENLDPAAAAPLLCAGITTYSPLKTWGAGPGKRVGIVGIGGLGHLGVKYSHALGATTVGFTTSPDKSDMIRGLGADDVIVSTDGDAMANAQETFDLIVSTVPQSHDVNPYLRLLKPDGTLVLVGAVEPLTEPIDARLLVLKRRRLAGSNIGSISELQEMLDFSGSHNIVADIELINADYINKAFERVTKNDVTFRFVIDTATIPAE
ncbi:MAG: NAD(P)-dependent alcohol dehydrogenase [Microbacteriaceae bacterium]|nr:NAD(P)-dependent alcohol dehydrogenase [Microbacteriaceae bacterium]